MSELISILIGIQLLTFVLYFIFYFLWGFHGFLWSIPIVFILQFITIYLSIKYIKEDGKTVKNIFGDIIADSIIVVFIGIIIAIIAGIIGIFVFKTHRIIAFFIIPLVGLTSFYSSIVIIDKIQN